MRKLIFLILGLSILWFGYWFVGSSAVENGFRSWLEQERSQGIQTQYETLATRGFPNRFDTTVTGLSVRDPVSGLGWSAPFFQIFALTYKPNHIIAVWPNRQTVQTATDEISVNNDHLRASVVFKPGPSLAFDRASLETENLSLVSDNGWTTDLGAALASARQSVARTNSYDLALTADGLRPPKAIRELFGPGSNLPATLEHIVMAAVLEFDRPWDRYVADGSTPVLQAISIEKFQAEWGNLGLAADGEVQVDRAGVPTGRINIRAKNWREMFQIAVRAGFVDPNVSQTAENLLEILAQLSGDPDTLAAPLSFQNGRMSFGPIPLGMAPRVGRR